MSEPNTPAPQLKFSAILLVGAVVASFIFAGAFRQAPELRLPAYLTDEICGNPAELPDEPDAHAAHGKTEAPAEEELPKPGPNYFAGGLWSDQLGLAALSELVAATSNPHRQGHRLLVQWAGDKLVALDVSPINADPSKANAPADLAIVSVDHAGPDPSPEFGTAIQKFVETLTSPKKIVILPPLPGSDKVPDSDFPYDWTYLMVNDKVDVVDWTLIEPQADIKGFAMSGYLKSWLQMPQAIKAGTTASSTADLINDLDAIAAAKDRAEILFEVIQRSPYEVVPALEKSASSERNIPLVLLLHRVMRVHTDKLIPQAAKSENPALRQAAARAIGALKDQTTDPIGMLTLLAEDREMPVRAEALTACSKIGGRAAAGVAQLVGDYEMSDNLRSTFMSAMQVLQTYGEPIPPDSRASRFRRMPINDLLNEERDALVCKILLERRDLPDNQVKAVATELGKAAKADPLTAYLDYLETLTPTTLASRAILLKTLVAWDRGELNKQNKRLNAIASSKAADQLRSAAAGSVIQSMTNGTELMPSIDGILFKGLAWVTDTNQAEGMSELLFDAAINPNAVVPKTRQVPALDAMQYLPTKAIGASQVAAVLKIARTAEDAEIRFAAIRAINNLPKALQPQDMSDLALTSLTVRAVPGKLAYDLANLTVTAGRPVEITLINPDTMPHNLVITKPGSGAAIGMQVTAMGPSESAAINYVPESPDILHHTIMVPAGASDTLRFVAPRQPGSYDYVCTFPGHYTTMNGKLQVVAP